MASHPTFCRKHTSIRSILVKIGRIGHFDVKKLQKKIQTDSDTFDGLMTSYFDDDVISDVFRKHTST